MVLLIFIMSFCATPCHLSSPHILAAYLFTTGHLHSLTSFVSYLHVLFENVVELNSCIDQVKRRNLKCLCLTLPSAASAPKASCLM